MGCWQFRDKVTPPLDIKFEADQQQLRSIDHGCCLAAYCVGRIPARGIPEGFDTPFLLRRGSETHAESPIA